MCDCYQQLLYYETNTSVHWILSLFIALYCICGLSFFGVFLSLIFSSIHWIPPLTFHGLQKLQNPRNYPLAIQCTLHQ